MYTQVYPSYGRIRLTYLLVSAAMLMPMSGDTLGENPLPIPSDPSSKKETDHATKHLEPIKVLLLLGAGSLILGIVFYHQGISSPSPLFDIEQGKNLTGIPHEKPTTDRQIIANIVHAMCIDPDKSNGRFRRTSDREQCVHYRQESFFRSSASYQLFMLALKSLGATLDKQKEELISDTLAIEWKEYPLTPETFQYKWKNSIYELPTFNDLQCEVKNRGEEFELKPYYFTKKGKYPICSPVFGNKNFGVAILMVLPLKKSIYGTALLLLPL